MLRRFSLGYTFFIRSSDALIITLALSFSTLIRIRLPIGQDAIKETFATPLALYILAIAVWQLAFQLCEVYQPTASAWLWREIQHIILGNGISALLFFGILYLSYRDYSRLQSIYFLILSVISTVSYRVILRTLNKLVKRQVERRRYAIVVGSDANAERIGKTIMLYHWTGLSLLGYVKHHADDELFPDIGDQLLGTVDDLPRLVDQHTISEVVIALKSPDYAYLSRLMEMLQYQVTNIRLAPDYSDLAYFHVSIENFGGIPVIGLREAVLSPSQRAAKRIFDMVTAGIAMIIGLPVFLAVAIAIRLESPGPVIFRQKRVGEYGRIFTMYKFRSMYTDNREVTDNVDHKQRQDPRVTKVGRFIRRTSLDELPQFINILLGDMSLVGPRPEMPWLVDKYEAWQRKRFEVPQGLTGWWQVTGRAEKPMYLNTEDDLFYIRNYSLWLDLQIVFRTVLIIFTGRGAF